MKINKEFKEKVFELKINNNLEEIINILNNKRNFCEECTNDHCLGLFALYGNEDPFNKKIYEDSINSYAEWLNKEKIESPNCDYSAADVELDRLKYNPNDPPSDCPFYKIIYSIKKILPLLNMINDNKIFESDSDDE